MTATAWTDFACLCYAGASLWGARLAAWRQRMVDIENAGAVFGWARRLP